MYYFLLQSWAPEACLHGADSSISAMSCKYSLIRAHLRRACIDPQIVKGPVTLHLPAGARRVAFSRQAPDLVKLKDFVRELPDATPAVFVVGAMAHGKIDASYVDSWVSVSEFPLSAACCLGRITNAFEDKWDIV